MWKVDPFTADSENISLETMIVREQEARRGLKQVDGTVYHNRNQADGGNAYVADLRFGARCFRLRASGWEPATTVGSRSHQVLRG